MDLTTEAAIDRAAAALKVARQSAALPAVSFDWARSLALSSEGKFHSTPSAERDLVEQTEARYGEPVSGPLHAFRVPDEVTMGRALSASGTTALLGSTPVGYAPSLLSMSFLAPLVTWIPIPDGSGAITHPRGNGGLTASYKPNESTVVSTQTPAFASTSATPHELVIHGQVSRQLLRQSNASEIISLEITRESSIAVESGILNGSGTAGQPTGILGQITPTSGATLAYTGVLGLQTTVANANGLVDASRAAYATTPNVAQILKNRYKSTNWAQIWDGPLVRGSVDGILAAATLNVPSATLLYGDFSTVAVPVWGGVTVETDPFSGFTSGLVGFRVIVSYDVNLRFGTAPFAALNGIT